jgi:hypothetical protein
MEDLGLVAELFKTSSNLERAAASLEKMSSGQEEIEHAEKEALLWSGEFLRAVDWGAQQQASKPVAGGLALQATSVRPTFYSCLFRMAPQLRDAGLQNEKDLTSFLSNLYRNLLSACTPGRGHKKLTSDQSKLGAFLLHGMAESILVQINNNGLPRPTATLKDEWKPTANELTTVLAI